MFAQIPISGGELIIALSQLLGFQGVKDFSVVGGRDESVSDGADGFIKVCLGSEGIEGGLG